MGNRDIAHISAVIDYIETHLDRRLDLDILARAADYSKYHLHRMFTAAAGMTPHDYILRRQLTHAARLLLYSEMPVLDIALLCGYESRQSFTSAFREMYKMTPARFRKEGEFYPLLMRFTLCTDLSGRDFTADDIRMAGRTDIPAWMELVRMTVDGFPHLTESSYRQDLEARISKKEALILKDGETAVGAAAFSLYHDAPDPGRISVHIDFLCVHPQYRARGITRLFLEWFSRQPERFFMQAGAGSNACLELSITTFREGDRADTGYRAELKRLGFEERELLIEFGYPSQRFVLPISRASTGADTETSGSAEDRRDPIEHIECIKQLERRT